MLMGEYFQNNHKKGGDGVSVFIINIIVTEVKF